MIGWKNKKLQTFGSASKNASFQANHRTVRYFNPANGTIDFALIFAMGVVKSFEVVNVQPSGQLTVLQSIDATADKSLEVSQS